MISETIDSRLRTDRIILILGLTLSLATQMLAQPGVLRLGEPVTGALAKDEVRSFLIGLRSGQFLELALAAEEGTYQFQLFSPDSNEISSASVASNAAWDSRLAWVAAVAGNYQVRTQKVSGEAGPFRISVEVLRDSGDGDDTRVAAWGAFNSAVRLSRGRQREEAKQAAEEYAKASALFHELDQQGQQAWAESGRCSSLFRSAGYAEAKDCLSSLLPLWQEIWNEDQATEALNGLGTATFLLGDPTAAVAFLEQGLERSRRFELPNREGTILNVLGVVYNALGNSVLELESLKAGLEIRRRLGNPGSISGSLNNLGAFHNDRGQYQEAVSFPPRSRGNSPHDWK